MRDIIWTAIKQQQSIYHQDICQQVEDYVQHSVIIFQSAHILLKHLRYRHTFIYCVSHISAYYMTKLNKLCYFITTASILNEFPCAICLWRKVNKHFSASPNIFSVSEKKSEEISPTCLLENNFESTN